MESLGAIVRLERTGEMGCVERAQIGRMFAHEAGAGVFGAEDVVMAADVDAFVMSAKVTLPLRRRERQKGAGQIFEEEEEEGELRRAEERAESRAVGGRRGKAKQRIRSAHPPAR